jgi:hypothetical protein
MPKRRAKKPKSMSRAKAASVASRIRWDRLTAAQRRKAVAASQAAITPEDRQAITSKGGKARAKALTKRERSQAASQAASAISSEAARQRALKAWETKRRKVAD